MTMVDGPSVREAAREHGIPEPVAAELTRRLRPCVYLAPLEDLPPSLRDTARPAGRLGGLPLLPKDVEWPAGKEPLVMTVDCAALPRDVLDIQLPDEGSLLFFTHIAYPPESSAVVHVPADAETEERPAVHEIDGESWPIEVHEQRTLYPVVGSTVDDGWPDEGAALAFVEAQDDGEERLDRFVKAVLDSAHGGTPFTGFIQLGGYSRPWQVAPDEEDLVLFAQIQGDAVDNGNPFLNLIVGTRADIAAGRYDLLEHDQQC